MDMSVDQRPSRPTRNWGRKAGVLGVLAVLLLLAALIPGVRVQGLEVGLAAALMLAALGQRLEPMQGLIYVVLVLVPAVLWGISLRPAPAGPSPDAEAGGEETPQLSPRAARNLAWAGLTLLVFFQVTMMANRSVTEALKNQKLRSGEETKMAAQDFLRHLYYGNVDAAYAALTPSYARNLSKETLTQYGKEWRESFQQLEALDPKGYFFGLSPEGPYTGIDYAYRGTKGEGMLRLHLMEERNVWRVKQFIFAVKQELPTNDLPSVIPKPVPSGQPAKPTTPAPAPSGGQ